jgi:hypothetical protein
VQAGTAGAHRGQAQPLLCLPFGAQAILIAACAQAELIAACTQAEMIAACTQSEIIAESSASAPEHIS